MATGIYIQIQEFFLNSTLNFRCLMHVCYSLNHTK